MNISGALTDSDLKGRDKNRTSAHTSGGRKQKSVHYVGSACCYYVKASLSGPYPDNQAPNECLVSVLGSGLDMINICQI